MNQKFLFKLSLCAVVSLNTAYAASMSKSEFKASEERIETDYKADRKACQTRSGNSNDICEKQAHAKQKIARAQLQADYSGTASDQNKLRLVKADSSYDVAKEICDDKSGNDKDVCVKEAKAVQTKARAEAKMNEQVSEAKTDAIKNQRDADYQVAAEKCDVLVAEAKASCIASAKNQFGQN